MKVDEFLSFAREYMDEHGLTAWKLAIDNAVRRHGQCQHSKRTLSFSKHYIENNLQSKILNTLIHEIAHALTPGHGHDDIWAKKCEDLGYPNALRCTADTIMPQGKYQAHCAKCGYLPYFKHRQTKTQWIHRHCGGKLIYTDAVSKVVSDG